jgi:hypothetical protein
VEGTLFLYARLVPCVLLLWQALPRCHNNPFSCYEPCIHLSWYLNHRWVLILSNSNLLQLFTWYHCSIVHWDSGHFWYWAIKVGKPISRHPNFIISLLQSSSVIFLQLTWILYFIHNLTAGFKVASQRKCGTEDVAVCAFSPALIVPDAFHSIFNLGQLCSYSCMATLSVAHSW